MSIPCVNELMKLDNQTLPWSVNQARVLGGGEKTLLVMFGIFGSQVNCVLVPFPPEDMAAQTTSWRVTRFSTPGRCWRSCYGLQRLRTLSVMLECEAGT